MLFSSRLKTARKAAGLTQQELSDALRVPVSTFRNWEQGHNAPSQDILIDIARTLDCSADFLLGLIDEPRHLDKPNPILEDPTARLNDLWPLLNADARKRIVAYADDLYASGRYRNPIG